MHCKFRSDQSIRTLPAFNQQAGKAGHISGSHMMHLQEISGSRQFQAPGLGLGGCCSAEAEASSIAASNLVIESCVVGALRV